MSTRGALSTWLFLRLLGLVYLAAFWSLDSQVLGLAGSHGILPAADLMSNARAWTTDAHLGAVDQFLQWPTIFWWGASDAWLRGACEAGMVLALLLTAGVGSVLVLPALWLLYLSLATVTGDFLAFQWDSLLIETGALACALAPWTLWERPGAHDPPPLARWLVWWLLFRLMFASGVVKLTSGDPLWHNLTALTVHFETQPLPTPLGWYAHQLPLTMQRASTAAVFAIELLAPWLIVLGARARVVAGAAFVLLQALIALTGNYAFFNLLSAALALTLIDDRIVLRSRPSSVSSPSSPAGPIGPGGRVAAYGQWALAIALAILVVPASAEILARQARVPLFTRTARSPLQDALRSLRVVNPYGLFAVMTPTRAEIAVEGSPDGQTWRRYEFRYKPGDPLKPLQWIAPYQPRLDWQMWFAALGDADDNPWFAGFCRRLLDGDADVLRLLASNPFPEAPPHVVRATRARYRMTTMSERRALNGALWTVGPAAPFHGPIGRP